MNTITPKPRREYIGSTDIAKLVGASPSTYGGPYAVYLAKVEGAEIADNPAMWAGRHLEASVATMYAERTGHTLDQPLGPALHPSFPYLGGTADRLVVDDPTLLLEAKTAGEDQLREVDADGNPLWGPEGSSGPDSVPLHYFIQCQWLMGLTGRRRCDLAAFFLGRARTFRIYRLDFDPALFESLVAAGVAFWRGHVECGVPPAMDLVPTDEVRASLLNQALREKNVLQASPEAAAVALDLYRASRQRKALEQVEETLKAHLAQSMATSGAQKLEGKAAGAKWSISVMGGGTSTKVQHEALERDLVNELLARGMAREEVEALQAAHTITFPKTPYLRGYWTALDKVFGNTLPESTPADPSAA